MLHTAVIVLKIIFGIVVLFPVVCYALGLYWGMGHRTRAYIFKDDSGSRLILSFGKSDIEKIEVKGIYSCFFMSFMLNPPLIVPAEGNSFEFKLSSKNLRSLANRRVVLVIKYNSYWSLSIVRTRIIKEVCSTISRT